MEIDEICWGDVKQENGRNALLNVIQKMERGEEQGMMKGGWPKTSVRRELEKKREVIKNLEGFIGGIC